MSFVSPTFKKRASASLDTLEVCVKHVQNTLQPKLETGDASILEHILQVEIHRLRSVYTSTGNPPVIFMSNVMASNGLADLKRANPKLTDTAPPTHIESIFQALTTTDNHQKHPITTKTSARNNEAGTLKPQNAANRVRKPKKAKQPRFTDLKGHILFLKTQEKEGLPLSRDGQPPFIRLPVAVLLRSSVTLKRLIEAKRQRLIDDSRDKVCYNPRNTQLKKTYITEYTIYVDALMDAPWAEKQAGYAELAALGKETIWKLIVRWSNCFNEDRKLGGGKKYAQATVKELLDLAILGKFLKCDAEFF
ncbi:hypothetical protein SBOR_0559 [Sclerotinia borealis F-4128]|uniref:Uncharacterized protein n=1 Tax=Sclerotinia borealis (strain F-4128) TaxID=1432307 RepID=W9CWS0_SCLBF|nr:hypothetical protein SBOR_0559 [Sclerotinia borealis F-4128]